MFITADLRCKQRRAFYQRMIEDAWLANILPERSCDEKYLAFLSQVNRDMVEALRLYKEKGSEHKEAGPESFRVPATGRADS